MASASSTKSDLAEKYKKMNEREHVLALPDTYIGSIEKINADMWVFDEAANAIAQKNILCNLGLYKIFDEAIVNARDHQVRTAQAILNAVPNEFPVTTIGVQCSEEQGTISITNNGTAIPIEIHPEYNIYIPELIFANLRSSTNYNTEEKRIVGGKNGFGIKLAFIFSSWAKVEIVDVVTKRKYTQEFKNNLNEICPPAIEKLKGAVKSSYVSITFRPDYSRFGFDGLTKDMISLFKKRTYDIAAVTDKSVKVMYNDAILPVKTFKQYISMYIGDDTKFIYEEHSARWEYAVAIAPANEFTQVSWVNGIFTRTGGKHVEYILNQITRKIADFIEKKKKVQVKTTAIKEQLMLFLRCDIENPAFDSQTKDCMTLPFGKFGSTCTVSDQFCEKIAKMGVMDQACSVTEARENKLAKRTDGAKTRSVRGIANFIDANFAGTDKSGECTLILCEGLSAQSGVVSGLSSNDRNYIGIFPLKGKVLNVRGEGTAKIAANKEITDLKKILGLENGRTYTEEDVRRRLRYGKIMFLTDADADGSHIKALCVNLFHCEWASLVKIGGFLSFMNTPILRATRGKEVLSFYHEGEYETWKQTVGEASLNAWKIKYFKGLGTSTSAEFKEYFANKKQVDFVYKDKDTDDKIDQIFNKKRADERKTWLENYDKSARLNTSNSTVSYEDFIDKELIHFSVYDCERSIPNVMDGLKISLRKILFCAFKRKLNAEIKVAQFSGYVSEHSMYHHGEQSLHSAIVNMAQNFVGSNNINILEPHGQFGCLSPETPILMWDSSIKQAKNIVVGDILVGDDGYQRNVLHTTSGIDEMFEITDSLGKKITVNSQHILTLYFTKNYDIYWKESHSCWYMNYYDKNAENIFTKSIKTSNGKTKHNNHFNKSKLTKEEAYDELVDFRSKIIQENSSSKVIDIKLTNYLKLSKTLKRSLFAISNSCNIHWDKQSVPIDPYVFGLWLGDGDHSGCGFTTIDDEVVKAFALWSDTINAEVVHNNNCGRNDCYHYEIRRKGSGQKISIGDSKNSSESCKACQMSRKKHTSCDWIFEKTDPIVEYGVAINGMKRKDLNPFKEILKKNNLFKNKDIPNCYLYNDEETRIQLLAGFIDTDGCLKEQKNGVCRFEIGQSERLHGHLIDKIDIICKSLGFATSISYSNQTKKTSKNEIMTMKTISIYGDIERIPTRLLRKQATKQTRIRHSMHYTPFIVKPLGKGDFCGWQVDNNERFLLGNYIVTHNSRLQGGDDSASERYIFTQLTELTRTVFPEMDDKILTYINDDGTLVEPEFYVPIIPFVLVNGSQGIGTGFSTSIPSYNPMDLVANLRAKLNAPNSAATELPELVPYYEGFKGTVHKISDAKFLIKGAYKKIDDDKIVITELPVGTWTMPYIQFMEELADPSSAAPSSAAGAKKAAAPTVSLIKDFVNLSTETNVHIEVHFVKGKLAALEEITSAEHINGVEKYLKLSTTVSTTNMHLFTAELKLKKYMSTQEIIDDFFVVRLEAYKKRKAYLLENLMHKLKIMSNKARYIQANLDDTIDLRRKTVQQVQEMLASAGLDEIDGSYKYLTKLPMDSVSAENVAAILREKEETEREFQTLFATTESQLWLNELVEFEEKYNKYKKMREQIQLAGADAGASDAPKKKIVRKIVAKK